MTTYRLPGRYLPPRRYRYPYRRRGGSIGPWAGAGLILLAAAGTHGKIAAPLIHHAPPPAVQPAAGGASGAAQLSTASANVALGQQLAAADGWTAANGQWQCLDALWTRESGWRTEVWNYGGSGAYGIPQSLPASKMASAGTDWQTNPATQIKWGLGYIALTYGTPCGAWSHETSAGWY